MFRAATGGKGLMLEIMKVRALAANLRPTKSLFDKGQKVVYRFIYNHFISLQQEELIAEVSKLQRKKKDLNAEVNTALVAAQARMWSVREERDQFEEANNQIFEHLKTKDDMLEALDGDDDDI